MRKNYKHSEETLKKMRIARRKRIITEETKLKLKKSLTGRKITWNKKISESLKGKKNTWAKNNPQTFKKGMIPWNKGLKNTFQHTLEHRKKMSKLMRGEKSPNWKGGITSEYRMRMETLDWRLIREVCLNRDGRRCQVCGEFNKKLEIHHIVPWRISHDDSLENLMSVCRPCHVSLEKGWKNE
jgi:hypothetical protein